MKVKVLALLMLASMGAQATDCTNAGIQPSTDESVNFETPPDGTGAINVNLHRYFPENGVGQDD